MVYYNTIFCNMIYNVMHILKSYNIKLYPCASIVCYLHGKTNFKCSALKHVTRKKRENKVT